MSQVRIVDTVRQGEASVFTVEMGEEHRFTVTVPDSVATEMHADAETLVAESFRFLLEHESASAIRPQFEITVIARYFPSWREEMRRRLP